MNKRSIIPAICLLLSIVTVQSQEPDTVHVHLSLQGAIETAREQSPDALIAKNQFRNSYWQYQVFRADFFPQIGLEATLPDGSRTIEQITLPDGSDAFVDRNLINSSLDLTINQRVPFTGGQIFMRSGLDRLDILRDEVETSYQTTPVSIGFVQPLFGFNQMAWQLDIEPLKLEQAHRAYTETMEDVAITAVGRFFDFYLAQINLEIARQNLANNDTLYNISRGRYNIGKIAEDELLQMELNLLNAENNLEQARLEVENSRFRLRTFLGYREGVLIDLHRPTMPEPFVVPAQKAVELAQERQEQMIAMERQLMEAERDLAQARRENRFRADLFASFGLTNRADLLADIYQSPRDQQQLRIGLQVPILNWGKAQAQVAMAEANRELVETTVERDRMNFRQDIYLFVKRFNMQWRQVEIAAKTDTVSQKRYEIARHRFMLGKIDIVDLQNAYIEKDRARRSYINQLREFWQQYYELRRRTHYDFREKEVIQWRLDAF